MRNYDATRELAKRGDKPQVSNSQSEYTEDEIASALADGGHARFIKRLFGDYPKSFSEEVNVSPELLEMFEMAKFQEADARLKKIEQLAITAEEDGDLMAGEIAYAQFEELLDHITRRWPPDKYKHLYKHYDPR